MKEPQTVFHWIYLTADCIPSSLYTHSSAESRMVKNKFCWISYSCRERPCFIKMSSKLGTLKATANCPQNLLECVLLAMKVSEWVSEVAQSCLTLCNPMDYSLQGSSVHGIFQARVLVWVAISFPRGFSQPRDWTQDSWIAGRCFTVWAPGKPFGSHGWILLSHHHESWWFGVSPWW